MSMSRSLIRVGYNANVHRILNAQSLNQTITLSRCYSSSQNDDVKVQPKKLGKKLSSAELRKQRNKLAKSSLKDIFESFMPSFSNDEDEVFDIDPKPIYLEPRKFLTLNQPLQQCVLTDLEKQLRKKWTSISPEVKKFHYFLCYDNHGPRESFPSLDYLGAPLDLPFKLHTVGSTTPTAQTPVHLQNFKLNLNRVGPKREAQAQKDARLDPFSKFVLFLVVLLTLLNFKRDSKVQQTEKIPVNKYEDSLLERQKLEQDQIDRFEKEHPETLIKEEPKKSTTSKKWYYLWLK